MVPDPAATPSVYDAHMGRVNVYLPPELHRLVKAAGIPVSQVCQQALRRELRDRDRERTARQTVLWDHNTPDGRP